jgi:hypothetical protein
MTKLPRSAPAPSREDFYQPPPRPAFGFLLGGTTLGIFFGCILLCAGAGPPEVVIILLAIFGAVTGGLLEALWPKPALIPKPKRVETKPQPGNSRHECRRCGEMFSPAPVVCPMCGHSENKSS